jgi:hypothetical protein
MRKSKQPPPPVPFFWLREELPEIAKIVEAELRRMREKDLAAQVRELRIYGRCRCGAPPCGTFYCVPYEEYAELLRKHLYRDIGTLVGVAKGRIVRVETLDDRVDEILDRLFPEDADLRKGTSHSRREIDSTHITREPTYTKLT